MQEIEVPFEFQRNQIVLRGKVNQTHYATFLLDTGTSPSSIDISFAKHIGLRLEPLEEEEKRFGPKRVIVYETLMQSVDVGEVHSPRIAAMAISLSKLGERLGRQVQGVLGYDFLSDKVIQIDYVRGRLKFLNNGVADIIAASKVRGKDSVILPMRFLQGEEVETFPLVDDLYVNGKQIKVTLDTGSSLGLMLYPEAVRYLQLEKESESSLPESISSLGSRGLIKKTSVSSVRLKDMELDPKLVVLAPEENPGEITELDRRGGNLGNALLKDFRVTLDYRSKMIMLEKAESLQS